MHVMIIFFGHAYLLTVYLRYYSVLNVPEDIGFPRPNAKNLKKVKIGLGKSEKLLLYATSLTQRAPLPR